MTTDALDLSTIVIHNSPDVRAWPITSTITRLEFRPTGVHVEHTKNGGAGAWPNFRPPGWDGDLQFTLWIFLNISGQWHGTGGIEFWQSCDQNGGPPENFAKDWYYAADRWAPMTGHQPAVGELVGFMLTAGDARNNGAQSVQERSNLLLLPFPSSGAVYVAPAAPPDPIEPPHQPPVVDPDPIVLPSLTPVMIAPAQYDMITARFDAIDRQLAQARADVKTAGADLLKQLPALLRKALTGR
jgi:hypothetical protein